MPPSPQDPRRAPSIEPSTALPPGNKSFERVLNLPAPCPSFGYTGEGDWTPPLDPKSFPQLQRMEGGVGQIIQYVEGPMGELVICPDWAPSWEGGYGFGYDSESQFGFGELIAPPQIHYTEQFGGSVI